MDAFKLMMFLIRARTGIIITGKKKGDIHFKVNTIYYNLYIVKTSFFFKNFILKICKRHVHLLLQKTKLSTMRKTFGSTIREIHQTGLYDCRQHSKPHPTQASLFGIGSLTKQNKTEHMVHWLFLSGVYCLSFWKYFICTICIISNLLWTSWSYI